MNRAPAHLQKPERLAELRGARAFRSNRHLLIVEASAQASAANSHRDRFNLQWPAASAAGIDAARKDSRRRAAEMADVPHDACVLEREARRGLPWRWASCIHRSQPLEAEQNTVMNQAPCLNRVAALLQKPGRLAE